MTATRPRTKPQRKKTTPKPQPRMLPNARVPAAVGTMAMPKGTARFQAGKILTVTAEKDPRRVYPYFDAVAKLLEGECKIVRWNAMQILARLACVDKQRKIDAILDKYLAFIRGDNLISAANAIGGTGRIGLARPDLLDRIIPAILGVEQAAYETDECRNVATGHVLDVLAALGPQVCSQPEVAAFIQRQRKNTRSSVARKATQIAANLSSAD